MQPIEEQARQENDKLNIPYDLAYEPLVMSLGWFSLQTPHDNFPGTLLKRMCNDRYIKYMYIAYLSTNLYIISRCMSAEECLRQYLRLIRRNACQSNVSDFIKKYIQ